MLSHTLHIKVDIILHSVFCMIPTIAWIFQLSYLNAWWRHQKETFFALLALCAGNSPVPVEFPSQRPVTRSFDVFFDLCLNKRLSKQSWGWWFEMPSRSLWCYCNGKTCLIIISVWKYPKLGYFQTVIFMKRVFIKMACILHLNNYAHGLQFASIHCGWMQASLTHILLGCITDTGDIILFSRYACSNPKGYFIGNTELVWLKNNLTCEKDLTSYVSLWMQY